MGQLRNGRTDGVGSNWPVEWTPREGGTPGMVRRVRRVLDVSQRGLAAQLQVSQSVVARWETGRTCPSAEAMKAMFDLAGLRVVVLDGDGSPVAPMRDDGARDRGARRFPAHVDLFGGGWWRHLQRSLKGQPVDHPALYQFVAEATWHDECRERRRERIRLRLRDEMVEWRHAAVTETCRRRDEGPD